MATKSQIALGIDLNDYLDNDPSKLSKLKTRGNYDILFIAKRDPNNKDVPFVYTCGENGFAVRSAHCYSTGAALDSDVYSSHEDIVLREPSEANADTSTEELYYAVSTDESNYGVIGSAKTLREAEILLKEDIADARSNDYDLPEIEWENYYIFKASKVYAYKPEPVTKYTLQETEI